MVNVRLPKCHVKMKGLDESTIKYYVNDKLVSKEEHKRASLECEAWLLLKLKRWDEIELSYGDKG